MNQPKLCVVVTGETMDELRRNRDAATGADLVELRLDYVDRPDVAAALEGRRTPVVLTCRARWEGGLFEGSEEERHRILQTALDLGADYVDTEAAASFTPDLVRNTGGRRVVVSEHHFDGAPVDIPGRVAALAASGAEIVKLAFHTERLDQMLPLFDLAPTTRNAAQGHVFIAMGNAGLPSRILAAPLGSQWTYAGDAVAPGQLTVERLLRDFRFRRISPDAHLYGVVGNPVMHSRSPIMHNAGFAALGLNAAYVPLEAQDTEDFVRFARRSGLRGASITTPFKVSLMPYFDEIDRVATRVGAVNTLVVRDGRWIGANTDVDGFLAPLRARITLRGLRATVLGAGGAARAAAVALADQGADVMISARQPDAAREVAELARGRVGEYPPRGSSWDLLVNATTAGSTAVPGNPMAGAPLDGRLVFDLIYAPAETELLRAAAASGCETIGGLAMLIAQAERQFELWTGQRPPAGLFESVAPDGFARARLAPHLESPSGL
jgi:3-dehydroquinate dehydratase / shikimate dehydrogenase